MVISSVNSGKYDELVNWCTYIHSVSNNTYTLLENLLEWFRTQTGQMIPSIKSVSLKTIVDDVFALCNPIAIRKNITLKNENTTAALVYCDAEMTQTVVRNLISNALKFTNTNGTVSIKIQEMTNETEVMVIDNGIGIHPSVIPNLFQLNKNRSTLGTAKEKGTGLGLVLCHDLIEKQGGRIWVESTEGEGSVFHFTLPKNLS